MAMRIVLLVGVVLVSVPATVQASLRDWYKLDETSGGAAANSGSRGTPATLYDSGGESPVPGDGTSSGPLWTNDPTRGRVLSFDGDSDYANAGTIPSLSINDTFTWAFWEKEAAGNGNNDVTVGNRYMDTEVQGGSVWTKFTPTGFEYTGATKITNNVTDDVWVHRAVVKNGSTLTLYVNGISAGTSTAAAAHAELPFYLGGDRHAEQWAGLLDDVATWTDALPASSIEGLANGTYTPGTAPIPEPASLGLLAFGTMGLPIRRRPHCHL